MKTWRKQPGDRLDYDFIFTDWLRGDNDHITSVEVDSPKGIEFIGTAFEDASDTVKLWFAGGANGQQYKCALRVTTAKGRVKEVDFIIVVVEI